MPSIDACGADGLALSLAIERDAETLRGAGGTPTLERYLKSIPALRDIPLALDAAIECVLAGSPEPLAAAAELARLHPDLSDAIVACALAFGIEGDAPAEMRKDELVFGRFRLTERLGNGATAESWLARDELLTKGADEVFVVVKRYDDAIGSEAREHALRETRALLRMPARCAPVLVAFHAPPAAAAYLVVRHEASRQLGSADDLAEAARTLEQLHASGVCHGDLKPEHIMIRVDGSAYFIDFGCAEAATDAGRRADRARLVNMAGALARTALERGLSRVARWALERGHGRVSHAALGAASPRTRRRAARRGAVVVALAGAALAGGLAFGAWYFKPPKGGIPTAGLVVDQFGKSGRLRGVRVNDKGEAIGFRMVIPELGGRSIELEGIQVLPNGQLRLMHTDSNKSANLPSLLVPLRQ